MNMLNKLIDIYNKLDDVEFSSFYKANLELKKELRDISNNPDISNDVRKAASLEHGILLFQLPIDSLNDFNLEPLPFYDIDNNYIEYFENRIKQAKNPFPLARYYNLLWLATKHNNYAIKAIENYFIAKDIAIRKRETNKEWTFDLIECLKRSFFIKRKTKIEINNINIEKAIISSISEFLDAGWGFNICKRLLDIILSSWNSFKEFLSYDFLNTINLFVKVKLKKEAFKAIIILELIIKISEKMNYDTKNMYENLGAAYEERINDFNKSNGSIVFCIEAINIYSKLKKFDKVEELKKLYEDISENMKFGMVKSEMDIEPLVAETKLRAAKLLELPVNDVIQFLACDKMFFPPMDIIMSEINNEEKGLLSFLGGNYNIFDLRGNLVKTYSTEEEKEWFKIMQLYDWLMQMHTISLNITLNEFISAKKITSNDIYSYMMNNTWLSEKFKIPNNMDKEIYYTYSNILHTLIKEYFRLANNSISSERVTHSDYSMFIDSATLKIEGILRELFTLHKFPTIIHDSNTGTVREKDLNALLYDENIKAIFDDDELMFFKYLFIEQKGLNLRNRLAHSLLLEQEYDIEKATLLFFALLRFFKFQLKKNR